MFQNTTQHLIHKASCIMEYMLYKEIARNAGGYTLLPTYTYIIYLHTLKGTRGTVSGQASLAKELERVGTHGRTKSTAPSAAGSRCRHRLGFRA